MAGNNQIESWNQQNRNKKNYKESMRQLVLPENRWNRQTFIQTNQTNQDRERISKFTKSKMKQGT